MVSDTARSLAPHIWIRRLVAAFLAISYLLLAVGLIQMSVVPTKYLWLFLPLYGLILAFIGWRLLTSKRNWRHPLFLLALCAAILFTITNAAGYMVLRSTNGLLGSVQPAQTSYVDYVLVAKKGSSIQVGAANTVGVVTNDPTYQANTKALTNETPAKQQTAATLTDAVESLRTGSTELISIRKASLSLIEDNYADFYKDVVVLATYQVKGDTSDQPTADVAKPFVLYVSGIDTYGDISTVSRSDVNMLVVINPQTRQILLVNTPRDYYVQLHGTTGTKDKLTHAGIYGIDMSRKTMQDLYGVPIDYYTRVNFSSLVNIIDTIGPIDVYSDYSFKSYHEGYNTLNSKQALEFARERYSFNEGDRQRGRNQQRVIEAIVAKLNRPENAIHMNAILATIQGSVETNMSEASLKKLIRTQLNDMKAWSVESIDVDGTGSMQATYSMGAQPLYVMVPNNISLGTAQQRIRDILIAH